MLIVPSSHTKSWAWVNSKIPGRNPPLNCTITLNTIQEHKTKAKYMISLDYRSMGADEGNLQVMDVDVIL